MCVWCCKKHFPHLIQVTTIEKFLPFHAACSQGHLDILKLLIEYGNASVTACIATSNNKQHYPRVFADERGQRYSFLFDLNALDVNEYTGLGSAVCANRHDICQYLLNLRVRLLSESEQLQLEQLHQRFAVGAARSSLSPSSSLSSSLSSAATSAAAAATASASQPSLAMFSSSRPIGVGGGGGGGGATAASATASATSESQPTAAAAAAAAHISYSSSILSGLESIATGQPIFSSSVSFFDHLKNAFMDTIAPTSASASNAAPTSAFSAAFIDDQANEHQQDQHQSNDDTDESRATMSMLPLDAQSRRNLAAAFALSSSSNSTSGGGGGSKTVFFNPINLNGYSKFGNTCLHDAIRQRNYALVAMLVQHGADVHLPVYDMSLASRLSPPPPPPQPSNNNNTTKSNNDEQAHQQQQQQLQQQKMRTANNIVSTSLCEALKQSDERIFLLLLDKHRTDDKLMFQMAYAKCIEMLLMATPEAATQAPFAKRVVGYLLKMRLVNDYEYRVSVRHRLMAPKLFNTDADASLTDATSDEAELDNGVVVNWSEMSPHLSVLYESWLLNATKSFRLAKQPSNQQQQQQQEQEQQQQQQQENPAETSGVSLLRQMMSIKRLHLHAITRLDLSNNQLRQLPLAIFQIESLRVLKCSHNELVELPTQRHAQLDDVNHNHNHSHASSTKTPSTAVTTTAIAVYWTCHALEELDADHNKLRALTAHVFQLRALKHLNVANNELDTLPIEMWQAPALFDLNVSFNKLSALPLISGSCLRDRLSNVRRGRANANATVYSNTPPAHQQQQQQQQQAGVTPRIGRRADETQQRQQQQQPLLKSATRRSTADRAVPVQDHPLKTPTNELSSPAWVSEIRETLIMN